MARSYAQIKVSVWRDDDFRRLPPDAQHLYFLLLTSPTLSLAGVTDWRPNRIAALAHGWTAKAVSKAAVPLVRDNYIVIDESTEEVLVRTFIKHDGILRSIKTTAGLVSGWSATYSMKLRAAITAEVQKLAENDGVSPAVRTACSPVLNGLSDTASDTPSEGVSDAAS